MVCTVHVLRRSVLSFSAVLALMRNKMANNNVSFFFPFGATVDAEAGLTAHSHCRVPATKARPIAQVPGVCISVCG